MTGEANGEKPKRQRQRKKIPEPLFITKTAIAQHLELGDIATLDGWIKEGTFPPPHSQPGERYMVWLRKHWNAYVETGRWPDEAFAIVARALSSSTR